MLRVARVLRIAVTEIEAAVIEPEEPATEPAVGTSGREPGAVPLLEQAIELFGWTEEQAAAALQTSVARVRAWRRGTRGMSLPEVMTVAALIGLRAVGGATGNSQVEELSERFPAAASALAPVDRS